MRLSPRAVTFLTLASAAAVAVPVTLAATGGNGTPANKAVAAGSTVEVIQPQKTEPILFATFKTSKPEDLLIGVSLECSILTDVSIQGGSDVHGATSSARGAIKVWVELDGTIVPITDASAPPQDPNAQRAGTEADKVTFCDRLHERTVTDAENGSDGIDSSRDYQDTKSANAFNWVRLNAGSGMHTLVVKAQFSSNVVGTANADGYIGNRTLVIEPTKLANDALIG